MSRRTFYRLKSNDLGFGWAFRVCKKWQRSVKRVKKKRKALGWLLYNYDQDNSGGLDMAEEMKEKVEEFLNVSVRV